MSTDTRSQDEYNADLQLKRVQAAKTLLESVELQRKLTQAQIHDRNRTFVFSDGIVDQTVETCIEVLLNWEKLDPRPVTIKLHSGGGGVLSGFHFIDFLLDYRERVPVYIEVGGCAASMAAAVLQCATIRTARTHSYVMIHEASTLQSGNSRASVAQIRDQLEVLEEFQERYETMILGRSNIDLETLKLETKKKDWWLRADKALELGLIDMILEPGETVESAIATIEA
jgi:ATP-dependent protease ClpP protease subunit